MRAAVYRPGAVEIKEIEKPTPKDNEVLVRVYATTITAADYRLRQMPFVLGWAFGLWRKKNPILGMELSGTVEAVGSSVTRFRAGDLVFGGTGFAMGTHAEYACAPEKMLELKPDNMTMEEAAAVFFGGITAATFLRMAKIQAGQNVLVYGASGSVGVFGVQLAKHFGARVTGVCSTGNLEMVKSLGADEVIDYTKEDYSRRGRVYDMVFDAVGKSGYSRSAAALKLGGTHVALALSGGISSLPGDIAQQAWIAMTKGVKVVGGIAKPVDTDLAFLRGLIAEGKLRTVIDRRYPLAEIADAHRYAEAGHKKGHVVIVI